MAVNKRLMGLGTAEVAGIKPSENFDTVLYTGTGSTQSITGGWIGKGGKFNGSSSKIVLPNSSLGITDAANFTFSCWFNTNSSTQDNQSIIWTNGSNAGARFGVGINSTSQGGDTSVYFGVGTSSFTYINSGTSAFTANTWVHVVCVKSSTTGMTLYVDGISKATNTNATGAASYTAPSGDNRIGGYKTTAESGWFNGKIDQVRIFDRALSSDEVTTLYGENSSPVDSDIVSGCVALYEFEDNVKDTANNGALKAIDTTDKAASFNGSSSKINTNYTKSGTTFSFSCWVNITDDGGRQYVFGDFDSNGTDSTASAALEISSDDNITLYCGNGTTLSSITATNGMIGYYDQWVHLAVTIDGTSGVIYRNGSSIATDTFSVSMKNGTNPIGLGYYSALGSVGELNGKLDQVRIYSSALDSDDVAELYAESADVPTTNLVAHYKLDGNALDETSNDNDGTASNITYVQSLVKGTESLDNGKAAHFNGSNGSLDIASSDLIQNNTESFSFWFKDKFVFGFYDPSVASSSDRRRWFIDNGTAGSIKIQVNNDQYNYEETGITTLDGNWHHLVATSGGKLYIDGIALTDFSTSYWVTDGTNGTSRDTIRMGTSDFIGSANQSYSEGQMDDLKIFDTALSADEVDALYSNDTADSDFPDSPVAHYKFDGNALDETGDYDGTASNVVYGYDGTATNITYSSALGFTPDFVWIKGRNQAYSNHIFDSVRGTGTAHTIYSNLTVGENTYPQNANFSSFDSNGFTVGSTSQTNALNSNNDTFVAWCWKAGGAAVSNTDGSTASSVSANQAAGFSIVKYTAGGAATVGHGLSQAPELIITKNLDISEQWFVYAEPVGTQKFLGLNTTSDATSNSGVYTNVGTDTFTNNISGTSRTYINYCFHSVDGYQKVGSYTGNNATNTVTTGFEPVFLMVKLTSATNGNWVIYDNVRSGSNPRTKKLAANESDIENDSASLGGDSLHQVNFTSTGFQLLETGGGVNTNKLDETYIYLAIAGDPDTTTPVKPKSFDVTTYSGSNSTQSIETRFKPDLVWIKGRSNSSNHALFDSIRGNTKRLESDNENDESTYSYFSSFDTNGFTVGNQNAVNTDGRTYVAWTWKAGDHDDNLPEINTNGTIESTVSVNDAAGFSIVKYTGNNTDNATVGHGLSSTPEIIIVKNLDLDKAWGVWHTGLTSGQILRFNADTQAQTPATAYFQDELNTADVFGLGTNDETNSTDDYIAYCWYSVSGYSKFGSYTGTGVSGKEVATGFKPDFVMIKRTDSTGNWFILDSARDNTNPNNSFLLANTSDQEKDLQVTDSLDFFNFIDNGFEVLNGGEFCNANNGTYIYMAFKIN